VEQVVFTRDAIVELFPVLKTSFEKLGIGIKSEKGQLESHFRHSKNTEVKVY
jgi:hypothetical protein